MWDIILTVLGAVLVIAAIIAVLVIISLLIVAVVYESVFGKRFNLQDSVHLPNMENYPDLESEPVSFASKRKYNLYGCYYYKKGETKFKGLIVFAHGIFDGHMGYMPKIDYFAKRGYKIFGFDNSGCHLSNGKSMRGLPQSAEDLSAALDYITETEEIKVKKLPLLLFGHSWGGYAVSAVSCYKVYDINGIFVQNGFNRPADIMLEEGSRMVGKWVYALAPYIRLYQKLKFGKAAEYTAYKGVKLASEHGTKFLIMHSTDDGTISLANSVLANVDRNDNIKLITVQNKGHSSLDSDKAIKHKKELDTAIYIKYGKNATTAQRKAYYDENKDKDIIDTYDEGLMEKIYKFYESVI